MPEYDLTIRVHDEEKLAVIIGALRGAGTLLTVSPVSESPPAADRPRTRRKRGAYKTDRNGTASVVVALLRRSPGGRASREEVEAALVTAGYSATSISPTTSSLVRGGLVRRLGNGHTFELVPTVP